MLSQMADMANSVYMVFHIVSTVNVPVPCENGSAVIIDLLLQLSSIYYLAFPACVIVGAAFKAKASSFKATARGPDAKAIKIWPRNQGRASRTTPLEF